jgi:hypothetical protein
MFRGSDEESASRLVREERAATGASAGRRRVESAAFVPARRTFAGTRLWWSGPSVPLPHGMALDDENLSSVQAMPFLLRKN